MSKNRGTAVRGVKVRATYDQLHRAWRAGAVRDFAYGMRSPSDPTIVWSVDGREFREKDYAAVSLATAVALDVAGIADVTIGPSWCGYAGLLVTFSDGTQRVEHYDGHRVTSELQSAEIAA